MRFWPRHTIACCCLLVALSRAGVGAESAELLQKLQEATKSHAGQVAVAVKHLERHDEAYLNADEVMPTASLIKFPVMVAAYRLVDQGKLDLARRVTLRAEDQVQGSGILTTHFSPGAQISVRDAIRLMIAYSDNTATNLVLDQIGLGTTAATMEQLGYPETRIHAKVFRGDTSIAPDRSRKYGLGSTTARDMVRLFERLHQNELASAESCTAMRQHLLACEDRQKLPRELPAGVKIAHKTGAVNAVRTDAGILLGPGGPIAICVLTANNEDKRWTADNAAEVLCGRLARLVYDHFQPASANTVSNPNSNPDPNPNPKLALGATGATVEALQRTLNLRLSPSPDLGIDGEFGPMTRDAVERFQQERQLAKTGELDAATWKALGPLEMESAPVSPPDEINSQVLTRDPERRSHQPPWVTCKAWAIADARTGVLLWGEHERESLDFASTTKIMTAYLVLRLAQQSPEVLDELVTFSTRADETNGSSAELRAGEQVTTRELLYGLLLPSGNDASVALAEHFGARLAGPEPKDADPLENFVAAMNRAASELGMHDTRYRNPHGLTAPGHRSTAADLLLLARAARSIPLFTDYVNTRQRGCSVSSIAGYTRHVVWKNTNRLLAIDGYHGVKTGTTDAAGACLVSSSFRGDDELLLVVLGSANSDARYVDSRNLFRWAWSRR